MKDACRDVIHRILGALCQPRDVYRIVYVAKRKCCDVISIQRKRPQYGRPRYRGLSFAPCCKLLPCAFNSALHCALARASVDTSPTQFREGTWHPFSHDLGAFTVTIPFNLDGYVGDDACCSVIGTIEA
jgi:hypothetical protein